MPKEIPPKAVKRARKEIAGACADWDKAKAKAQSVGKQKTRIKAKTEPLAAQKSESGLQFDPNALPPQTKLPAFDEIRRALDTLRALADGKAESIPQSMLAIANIQMGNVVLTMRALQAEINRLTLQMESAINMGIGIALTWDAGGLNHENRRSLQMTISRQTIRDFQANHTIITAPTDNGDGFMIEVKRIPK